MPQNLAYESAGLPVILIMGMSSGNLAFEPKAVMMCRNLAFLTF